MAIFTVTAFEENKLLEERIAFEFPGDSYEIMPGSSWLVSAAGTSIDLSERLGLPKGDVGSAIVTRVEGYHGRAPTPVWEWIKAKWEGSSHGV